MRKIGLAAALMCALALLPVVVRSAGFESYPPAGTVNPGDYLVLEQQPSPGVYTTVRALVSQLSGVISGAACTLFGGSAGQCVQGSNQIANALDYGALRDGVTDASGAINTAANTTVSGRYRDVYLPAGVFYINKPLTMNGGQCLRGDTKWTTQILVDKNFLASATSIISATCVQDLGIMFTQAQNATARGNGKTLAQGCDTSSGSIGVCQYPWAILTPTATTGAAGTLAGNASPVRTNIHRVMISAGWDGIDATQPGDIDEISIGTLDVGIQVDGWADFGHVSHIHGWNWGLTANASGTYGLVYSDGTNIGLNINRDDGAVYTDITLFRMRMVFTSISSRASVQGLHLDGTGSTFESYSNSATDTIRVSNMYFGWGAANTGTGLNCPVYIAGSAIVQIFNFDGLQNADKQATALVCQTGGSLLLATGKLNMQGTAPTSTITKSGVGTALRVQGVQFVECGDVCTLASPVISDTSTGTGGGTQITGNRFDQLVGATNVAFNIATDSLQNSTLGNSMANLITTLPAGGLGSYDRRYNPTPVPSSCGTGTPAVSAVSNDVSGTVTTGTGAPTACTLTFGQSYGANAPNITVTPEFAAATATMYVSAKSGTAFTVTFSAGLTSGKFDYHVGMSNGN